MYDIISFGDATVDVFLEISDATAVCSIDTRACTLNLSYADKVAVDAVIRIPAAGNASNNAVGSKRLGMKTAISTILGDDDSGHEIMQYWKKEKVAADYVVFDKKRGTNYSTVLKFGSERTILVYHEPRTYKFPAKLAPAKWVYYTSLGKGSEVMHEPLLKYIKKSGTKFVFQPGTFQMKLGRKAIAPLIAASEITIINKEEAQRILENPSHDIKVLLSEFRKLGAQIVIITDGPTGSYAYDGKEMLSLGIFDMPVIERTGCGDAFSTGLIAGLFHGKSLGEAMRWGTANSASVIGYIGPQKGLLTRVGMNTFLKRFPEQPKVL